MVQMLDLEATSVAVLELGKWKGAYTAIAVEAKCIFQIGASGIGGTAFVIGDGNFFPGMDVMDCVDCFTPCIAVPTIVSIWKAAVVYEAYSRIDATNHGVGTAGQSVGFDNATERVFAREIVMKQKELSLLDL